MINLNTLNQFRIKHPFAGLGDYTCGAFRIPNEDRKDLHVIASSGDGWDHVSVSLEDRCPTWEEMKRIKGLFFRSNETVIQYHPPESEYVNCHEYCLHLWRPQNVKIPLPPSYMVGPKEQNDT